MAGPSPISLTGGNFQDAEGNALALGYLTMELSQDSNVGGVNVCAGVEIKVPLDSSGSADGSVAVWGNPDLSPQNSYYRVTGYTAQGQPAWGPNNQQVTGSGSFDLGTWIPNQIFSWNPPTSTPILETNGTLNEVQTILDLEEGNNITLTDNGDGSVTIDAAQGGWILKINGSNEAPSPHSTVDFQQGGGVIFSDNGSGLVTWGLQGFQTANQGFILGGQDYLPVVDDTGGFWDTTGGAVYAVQLFVKVPQKINRISCFCVTGSSGAFTCGIYDVTGNTKIIDAGGGAFNLSASQKFLTVSSFSGQGTILQPGTYWFAFGAPAGANGNVLHHAIGTWFSQLVNGIDISNPQVTPTRFGKCANTISAGSLPSTLGAMTPIDHTFSISIPAVLFAA